VRGKITYLVSTCERIGLCCPESMAKLPTALRGKW
jgi:hypothetical protein